jgi:hypothetical protein
MPLGRPTRSIQRTLRKQFTALSKTIDAQLKATGVLDEVSTDATSYMRNREARENGSSKAAVGRGGQPLGDFRRREIERLFSRPPFIATSKLIQTAIDAWLIETTAALDPEYSSAYTTGGRAAQRKIGVRANFNLRNPAILQALTERANLLSGAIADDIFNRLRTVVAEEFYLKGQGVPQVARALDSEFSWLNRVRARTIAHQETLSITSDAQLTTYAASGVEMKRWLTTLDGNERPSHFEAHGQLVPIDEPFQVGGAALDYPGDPSGPLDQIMRCRCDFSPIVMADQQFEGSRVWDGNLAPDEFVREQRAA